MGTMLASQNPEAAQRLADESLPMPQVGTMVHFHPLPSEVRRNRTLLGALVIFADADNRTLDLAVFRDVDLSDSIGVQRVPEWNGNDRGWSRIQAAPAGEASDFAVLRADLDELRGLILGDFKKPDASVLDMINELDERAEKMEKHLKARPVLKPLKSAKVEPAPESDKVPARRGRPRRAA